MLSQFVYVYISSRFSSVVSKHGYKVRSGGVLPIATLTMWQWWSSTGIIGNIAPSTICHQHPAKYESISWNGDGP